MLSTCQTKSVSMVSENISLWKLFLEAQLHSLLGQNFSHRPKKRKTTPWKQNMFQGGGDEIYSWKEDRKEKQRQFKNGDE